MKKGLVNESLYPRVCFWNINGRIHLLKSTFIYDWVKSKFDIVFITETHLTKEQPFEIKDFKAFHNSYSTVEAAKPRGGISCFIKPSYIVHVKDVKMDIPENIRIHFKNGDVIFGSYIAPADSPYYNVMEFSNIANMFMPVDYGCVVFGGGDLNSRVGDCKGQLPKHTMRYLNNIDSVINDHGKEILKISQTFRYLQQRGTEISK